MIETTYPQDEYKRVVDLPLAWRDLVAEALKARGNSYCPYSRFPVGAAILTATGQIYSGCNVENASSGLTVCAERVALWKAVSEGESDFQALAVVTDVGATPCGACRQVLSEFEAGMTVLVADTGGHVWVLSLAQLLPNAFPRDDLSGRWIGGSMEPPSRDQEA